MGGNCVQWPFGLPIVSGVIPVMDFSTSITSVGMIETLIYAKIQGLSLAFFQSRLTDKGQKYEK